MNSAGTVTRRYKRGLKLIKGEFEGNVSYYYLYNAHGDVTGVANASGQVLNRYSYTPSGGQINVSSDINDFRYCGEQYDRETRNIYLRARYYDPARGRFTQEDPEKSGTNWYVYCENNPVNCIDISGQEYVRLIDLARAFGWGLDWNGVLAIIDPYNQGDWMGISPAPYSYTYISDGRTYVWDSEIASMVNMQLTGIKGDGYSGFDGSMHKRSGNYVEGISVNSITFDNSVLGERAANQFNDEVNQAMANLEWGMGAGLTILTGGLSRMAAAVVGVLVSAADFASINYSDYDFDLQAGEAIRISDYSGAQIGSMARVGVSTTIDIIDVYGNVIRTYSFYRG